MADLKALVLSLLLIAGVVLIHFQALRWLSGWQARLTTGGHARILAIIAGLIAAHIVEAALFAGGYGLGSGVLKLGRFIGDTAVSPAQLFYFSIETFTTQGVGDVYVVGPLRLVASLEPLAGLILIGWSTSFTFVAMGLDWALAGAPTSPPAPPATPPGRPPSP